VLLGLRSLRSARQKPRTHERGPRYPTCRSSLFLKQGDINNCACAPVSVSRRGFSRALIRGAHKFKTLGLEAFQHPHVAIVDAAQYGEVAAIR
jgi:hypothetical protein